MRSSHLFAVGSLVAACVRAASEDASLSQSLGADSECGAPGSAATGRQSQCALSALQHGSSRKTSLDLDSSEGADLVEAAREQYSSGAEENRSMELLGARNGVMPPSTPVQYNGISWPAINASANHKSEAHFFAIGDWGGMDGELIPPDGFPRMITYEGGHLPGPHVFPRSRMMCSNEALTNCFWGGKKQCSWSCGFADGVDDRAQLLVAEQMKKRAALHDPQFILNVGDNFYWGGIAKTCGHPMNQIHSATRHQFESIFEQVYRGPGLDGKPWLSVLGNHDWGGRMFTAGWDQQIAYTWASERWLMPAVYWHQRINFPEFTADVYMVDTNHHDANAPHKHQATNICSAEFNTPNATCASAGGPASVDDCAGWFHRLWEEQEQWLETKLSESDADWQLAVTHFPCGSNAQFWRKLHGRGLDLLVTGHRHDQELHKPWHSSLGGLTCFVTGGGGGITSEESVLRGTPTHSWPHVDTQYGFFDMTISKDTIKVESVDYLGEVVDSAIVYPKD